MKILALLLTAVAYAWTFAVYTYVETEVYNGTLLMAALKPYQLWTTVAPGGWPIYIKTEGVWTPVDLKSDLFAVVGEPREGCDVFLFYSLAYDSTSIITVCAKETTAVLAIGAERRSFNFGAGVNYISVDGRPTVEVVSSTAHMRVRSGYINTAFPPAVMSGVALVSAPNWNATVLLSQIYNLTRELHYTNERCAKSIESLKREMSRLREEVERLKKENESLKTVGPQALALYASIAVGIMASTLSIYLISNRQRRKILKSGVRT